MLSNYATTKYFWFGILFIGLLLTPQLAWAFSFDETIWSIFIGIGGIFTWIGGLALDFAINRLVLGMGTFLTGSVGVAVDQMWLIVRDIGNIVFIFGLIYIGLRMIAKTEDTSGRRALGTLIVAALLINFSLFITKTIVDFSNIAAAQIYEQVQVSGEYSVLGGGLGSKGIAGAFLDQMRLHTFASSGGSDGIVKQISEGEGFFAGTAKVIVFGFLMMVLMIVAGVVFLAGALLLIRRFIALTFLMIFSPLLFAGMVIPKFPTSKMWSALINNAFVAPAYILMLYISLFLVRGLGTNGSFSDAYAANAGNNGNFDLFVYFIIIAGFLIGSLEVAKRMSDSTTAAIDSRSRKIAGALTAGAAARLGRTTIGYAGQRLSTNNKLLDAASNSGAKGFAARRILEATRGAASSSFEVRQIGGLGKQLDAGEGRKGGFKKVLEDTTKREQAFAASLGTIDEGDGDIRVDARAKALRDAEAMPQGTDAQKEARKKAVAAAKANLEQEKRRRQIGSTYLDGSGTLTRETYEQRVQTLKRQIANAKTRRASASAAWNSAKTSPTSSKKATRIKRKQFEKEQKEVAKLQKQLHKAEKGGQKLDGYQGVVDPAGVRSTAITYLVGNTRYEAKQAQKAIKTKYQKEAGQTKEDANLQKQLEAIGKINSN